MSGVSLAMLGMETMSRRSMLSCQEDRLPYDHAIPRRSPGRPRGQGRLPPAAGGPLRRAGGGLPRTAELPRRRAGADLPVLREPADGGGDGGEDRGPGAARRAPRRGPGIALAAQADADGRPRAP